MLTLRYSQTAANPYITSLGSPQYASFRINAAQAFNGVGTFIAPLIASKAFFGGDSNAGDTASSLVSVKWAYVGIGCGKLGKLDIVIDSLSRNLIKTLIHYRCVRY